MNHSQRHHYLPEFFIKAFADVDGKLSLFDKSIGRIVKNRKSPKQIFFEWNRNTFLINGIETDFLEQIYQFGESKFAITHKKLIEKFEPIEITPYDVLHLTLFIAEIHWRIPSQDSKVYNLVQNLNQKNAPFRVKNKITNETIPFEQISALTKEPAFVGSMKKMKAIQDYLDSSKNIKIKNWLIYYSPKEAPQFKILCDNPLILRQEGKNILESELIFPLSKSKTVYHTKGKRLKEVPPENKVSIDILLFLQAEKYVCCPDYNYLQSISELAKLYNTTEKVNFLKNEIFKVFG